MIKPSITDPTVLGAWPHAVSAYRSIARAARPDSDHCLMLGYFGTTITISAVEHHVIARYVAQNEMQRGFLEAQLVRQAAPSRQVMLTSGEYMGLDGGGIPPPHVVPICIQRFFRRKMVGVRSKHADVVIESLRNHAHI